MAEDEELVSIEEETPIIQSREEAEPAPILSSLEEEQAEEKQESVSKKWPLPSISLPQIQPATEPIKDEDEEEDLSDLFEVPKSSIEKEDMSDLFEVSEEDVLGEEEEEESIEDLFEGNEEKEESEVAEDDGEKIKEEETPHWSDEDIRRYEELQRQQLARKPTYKRTAKRYTPPDQIGGIRQL